jgi:hypothetical protein
MYGFYKFILAFMSPLIALAPYLLFRQLGYSYAEHIVIAWFYLCIGALVSIALRLVGILPLSAEFYQIVLAASSIVLVAVALHFYWKVSVYANYKVWSRTLRVTISSFANILISGAVPTLFTWVLSN